MPAFLRLQASPNKENASMNCPVSSPTPVQDTAPYLGWFKDPQFLPRFLNVQADPHFMQINRERFETHIEGNTVPHNTLPTGDYGFERGVYIAKDTGGILYFTKSGLAIVLFEAGTDTKLTDALTSLTVLASLPREILDHVLKGEVVTVMRQTSASQPDLVDSDIYCLERSSDITIFAKHINSKGKSQLLIEEDIKARLSHTDEVVFFNE